MDPTSPGPQAAPRTYARSLPQRGDLARRSLLAAVVVAAAVFAVLAQLGENGVVTWWRLRAETARLQRQVEQVEAQNAVVARRLAELADDREALEKLAREEYGMRRADEEVLTVHQLAGAGDTPAERRP